MVKLINVEQMIDNQSNLFKERNLSQFSRLLNTTPVFVNYYHIDGITSTAAVGSRDIMSYVADDSPVKYNKVIEMPLYAIEVIDGSITFDENMGTTTEYEGTGLALNSILTPYPGDHFIIPSFNPNVIFMVSDVNTRTVRGEDHKIFTYTLVPSSRLKLIEKQVKEVYNTLFRNIGTEDKVLLRSDEYYALGDAIETYSDIAQLYLDEFLDKEIAYIRSPEWLNEREDLGHATCKYLIKFLMDNRIIYFDAILKSIFAFEHPLPFESRHNKIYNRTFPLMQFIKNKLKPDMDHWIAYHTLPFSLFKDINDFNMVQSVDFLQISDDSDPTQWAYRYMLLRKDYINAILAKDYSDMSELPKLVAKIYNNEDIPISEYKEAVEDYECDDLFRMYFFPYVMFGLSVKIQALQNKTTGTPDRNYLINK